MPLLSCFNRDRSIEGRRTVPNDRLCDLLMTTTDSHAPLLSLVTVCFNSERTVVETLVSVDRALALVNDGEVEHLIIDGGSRDATMALVEQHCGPHRRALSERDTGIYSAMNKGLQLARGKYVWFLNSDDLLDPSMANWMPELMHRLRSRKPHTLIGQIRMFRDHGDQRRLTRLWRLPRNLHRARQFGWHPPHPAFIGDRSFLLKLGGFDESKRIAADFKLMIDAVDRSPLRAERFQYNMTLMREGGASNANTRAIMRANIECYKSQRELGGSAIGAGIRVVLKLSRKVLQTLRFSNRTLAS